MISISKTKYFLIFALTFVLFYQAKILANDYLNYPTVQRIRILIKSPRMPMAVTGCHPNKSKLIRFTKVAEVVLIINQNQKWTSERFQDSFFSKIHGLYCATYLSLLPSTFSNEFNDSNKSIEKEKLRRIKGDVVLKTESEVSATFVAVHSQLTPPQMIGLVPSGCAAAFNTEVTNLLLMPIPYDTGCHKYSLFSKFKSQGYCILQSQTQLTSKELYAKNQSGFEIFYKIKSFKDKKRIDECPKDCELQNFKLIEIFRIENCRQFNIKIVSRYRFNRNDLELLVAHSEEFTGLFLIVQFGGLVALAFGLSIKQIATILAQKNRVIQKYLIKFILVFFGIICFYQTFLVTNRYLTYETVTQTLIENSYENCGLFPQLILAASPKSADYSEPSIFDLSNNGNIFSLFPKIETIRWKNAEIVPMTALTYRLETKRNQIIALEFNRSGIKEVLVDFNLNSSIRKSLVQLKQVNSDRKALSVSLIDKKQLFELKITQQTFRLLPPPFDTGCHDYDWLLPDWDSNWHLSGRYRCEHNCQESYFKKSLNCTIGFTNFYSFSQNGRLEKENKERFDACSVDVSYLFKNLTEIKSCLEMCKPTCLDYQYKVREVLSNNYDSKARLRLTFDDDFIVKYLSTAKMSFFDFFYEVFGLVSLWFGFAIVDIVCLFSKLLGNKN